MCQGVSHISKMNLIVNGAVPTLTINILSASRWNTCLLTSVPHDGDRISKMNLIANGTKRTLMIDVVSASQWNTCLLASSIPP